MDLTSVAEELYVLPPADFTAARGVKASDARQAGDAGLARAIRGLRRPAPAAWAINLLAHADAPGLDELASLGAELAGAQSSGSGDEVRRLSRRRHEMVAVLTAKSETLAAERGHPLSPAGQREAEGTLIAAIGDPAAAAAVTSGRLVRALFFTGVGEVDLEGAVAGPVPPLREAPPKPVRRRAPVDHGAAQRRLHDAEQAAAAADDEVRRAEEELARVEQARAETRSRVEEIERDLVATRERLRREADDVGRTTKHLDAARSEARRAAHDVDSAREAVEAAVDPQPR